MSHISKLLLTGIAGAILAFSLQGTAAAQDSEVRKISSYTCKEVMRWADDRDVAIAFLNGYILGKKQDASLDIEKLTEITDKFISMCLDNPSKSALAVMTGVHK